MGIIIHRSRHAQEYVVVPNSIARNTELSFTARGVLVMLLSLPPDWHVTADMLAQDNPDSREAIRKAMRELRAACYVVLCQERGHGGRIRRHLEVFDAPQTERGTPAFGATSGNSASSQAAPNAGIPAAIRTAFRSTKYGPKARAAACDRGGPAPHTEACRRGESAKCAQDWCECACHGRRPS
jgi:hypothetical protein